MKKAFLFTFCFALLSISYAQEVKVGADNSFTTSLNGYKTFGWTTDINQIPRGAIFIGANGVYIFNNESTRNKIKNAIKYELNAKGYQEDETNPDILVLFRVTEQPAKLQTYNGYEMIDQGLDSVRTPENIERVNVDPGTLLINLLDRRSGKVAWQGYASGILKPDMVNDDVKVREAVSSMFRQFNFTAKK